MARPKNADVLKGYFQRIQASKKWREDEKYDDLWCSLVDLYRGKHYDNLSKEDRIAVNIAFATVNVINPSVSVNNPKITVNSRKPEDGDRAVITEAVINYWWRHYGCQDEFRRAVKDFLIVGHGWIKTGYRYVEEQKAVAQQMTEDGEELDITDASHDQAESTTIVREDRPFAERVSPHDLYVDPDATSMSDLRWIAQRIRRGVQEVRRDPRYNKAAREAVVSTAWGKWDGVDEKRGTYKQTRDPDQGYVDVWEYYDIKRGTVGTFADCGDESSRFLIAPRQTPHAFGHPFVMLRNYDVPEHFYPIGDLEAIEPLQRELNATRTQMLNHRKRYARKWLYRPTGFTPAGTKALQSDEDNALVEVTGDEAFERLIAPMPSIPIPSDFYTQSEMIESDIDRVSAVSEYQRGGMPDIRRTATEAAMMQDASNARSADKLAIIEKTIALVASRLVAIAQQCITGDQVVRVAGPQAGPNWLVFTREWIAGEFDFEVEAGSTQPNNESFRRQQALQLVDALAPFMGGGIINMQMLAMHIMRTAFGISNPEAYIDPMGMGGMDPMAAMMQSGGMPPPEGGEAPPPDGAPVPAPEAPPNPAMGGQSIPESVLNMLATTKGLDVGNIPIG